MSKSTITITKRPMNSLVSKEVDNRLVRAEIVNESSKVRDIAVSVCKRLEVTRDEFYFMEDMMKKFKCSKLTIRER